MLSISTYANWEARELEFKNNINYGHVIIDNFLNKFIAEELAREATAMAKMIDDADTSYMIEYDNHENQKNKYSIYKEMYLPNMCRVFTKYINSNEFLNMLSILSGINNLHADSKLYGGGIHIIERGGKLSMHKDFNEHKIHGKSLFRKLNLLLYLNKEWNEEWGGDLILRLANEEKRVSPIFNRAIIFNSQNIVHGHPEPLQCPVGVTRNSLAYYYYNEEEPKEKRHIAEWTT